MGLRIDTYQLSELSKISGRGGAVPALFWWLPIGKWPEGQLRQVWSEFVNDRGSLCHRVGLALIKEPGQHDEGGTQDVSALAGRLAELVPEGSMFEGRWDRPEEDGQFLLLSGAYPHPGWGLLVKGGLAGERMEQLVHRALQRCEGDGMGGIKPIEAAAHAYHIWEQARHLRVSKQVRDERAVLEQAYGRINEVGAALQEITALFASQHFDGLGNVLARLNNYRSELGDLALFDEREFSAWKLDRQLHGFTDPGEQQTLKEVLGRFGAMRAAREVVRPKTITETGIGHLVKPFLRAADLAPTLEELFVQVEERVKKREDRFRTELEEALRNVERDLGHAQLALKSASEAIVKAEREHAQQRNQAETNFHQAFGGALQAQSEWGTRFLVEFESVCLEQGVPYSNIAWDPARMIGWKLWARGADLRLEDLYASAKQMVGGQEGFDLIGDPDSLANGSLFTDYVHHIAYSDLKRTPREVTIALVDKLRVSERRDIWRKHFSAEARADAGSVSAEELVLALGWTVDKAKAKVPLAGTLAAGGNQLRTGIDGNDLRIVLESYCKDIIDMASNELGLSGQDLFARVQATVPTYRTSHDTWAEEVAHVTLGSAVYILEALLPLAFSGAESNTKSVMGHLRSLGKLLNPESHDQEKTTAIPFDGEHAAGLVQELIGASDGLFGEMPWHFKAMQTTGRQPKVLTGTAWSHSHPEQRSLRIMLWTGERLEEDALIWNKERINPIITDPRIIRRPGHDRRTTP